MLVLSRTKNQRVRITGPDGVHNWVMLVSAGDNRARFGFECDPEYTVVREELIPKVGINHDGGPSKADGAPSDGWIGANK